MGVMKVSQIIKALERRFPKGNAESWDNVGLLVGNSGHEVKRVQISLDATERVIDRAIEDGVDMIITHHPLIFSPMKAITDGSLLGRKILKLIENKIALYSMHTNLDASPEGLNKYIADMIGLQDSKVIDEEYMDIYKMSIMVPEEWYQGVLKKVEEAKLSINGYEGVNYTGDVVERYRKTGEETLHIKESKRIDVIGEKGKLYEVLESVKRIHPYEEVAYEVIKIENKYFKSGIGRYAVLGEAKSIRDVAEGIKRDLKIDNIRMVSRSEDDMVKRVAIVNGSGMSFFKKLKRLKIDLFITGDIKYHEALDALEEGINLLDIGHYESEHFFHKLIVQELSKETVEISVFNDEAVFKYM